MKFKSIIFGIIASALFFACNDTLDEIGTTITPDNDKVNTYVDTIYIEASTIKVDSIYAKTVNGLLGEFEDPLFGNLKAGFMCQFYPLTMGPFPDEVIDNKIDSVLLKICFHYWVGDSLAPMELTVHPIKAETPLNKHYYTNMNPAQYADLSTVLGKKGYTVRNLNVSDSLYGSYGYNRSITVKLPQSLGQKLYDEFLKPQPNAYSSVDAFTKFFPGIYLTTTYGSGNIITVDSTDMYVHFKMNATTTDVGGNDSTYIANVRTMFSVNKEIIQLNSYKNTSDEKLLLPDDEKTYTKTPAGIYTKITIPIPQIKEKLGNRKFSNAKLAMVAYEIDDERLAMKFAPPSYMLLVNKDSVNTFFENQQAPDELTSYFATFSNYIYNFNNISSVIQNAIDNSDKYPDKNLELLMIPASFQFTTSSTGSQVPFASSNYLIPSGMMFKKGPKYLKLTVTTTEIVK